MRPIGAYHKWVLNAILSALCITIGYMFLMVPNVELITAAIFISGFLVGSRHGAVIGFVSETLFSGLNPYGTPAPPLLIAQVITMILVGTMGGVARKKAWLAEHRCRKMLYFGLIGFFLTLIFDVLTNLSTAPFAVGMDTSKILSYFLAGMGFSLLHIGINTISFIVIVPFVAEKLQRLTTE